MTDFSCTETVESGPVCREAASGPLPCLLRNNSDGARVKVSGAGRKRAESVRQNLEKFLQPLGTHAGVLCVTFADDCTRRFRGSNRSKNKLLPDLTPTKEAQRRLANFKRGVLKRFFGASITVREFTKRGRPHMHGGIDCKEDIAEGFNWDHYHALQNWNDAGRHGARPQGNLNRCPALARLHKILNAMAPLYGIGRIELTPVEKPDAIGFYLGGYLSEDEENKPADAKGTRAVNYSHDCPRVYKGAWSWANECGWLWRKKCAIWGAKHGFLDIDDAYAVMGPYWCYDHWEAIVDTVIPSEQYPSEAHAIHDAIIFTDESTTLADILAIAKSLPRGKQYRLVNRSSGEGQVAGGGLPAVELQRDGENWLAALQRATVAVPAPTVEELAELRFFDALRRSRDDWSKQETRRVPYIAGGDTKRGAADAWTASQGEVIPPEPPRRRVAAGGSQKGELLAVTAEQQAAVRPLREAEAIARWRGATSAPGIIDKAAPLRRYILRSTGSGHSTSGYQSPLHLPGSATCDANKKAGVVSTS